MSNNDKIFWGYNWMKKLEKTSKYLLLILLIELFLVLAIFVIFMFKSYLIVVYPTLLNSSSIGNWGAFGDFFGGILNPVFGFFSMILIIFTITQQQKSLEQTSEQIKLSFEEMTKSVAAQEKQAELSEKQLNELLKKTALEDSVRILNSLIEDLKISIDEELVCYKNQGRARTLKSQLLEVVRQNNAEQKSDFLKCNTYAYDHFVDVYNYATSVLYKLKQKEEEGITYNYYQKKLDIFKKLKIPEGLQCTSD
jgi:uncharacterized membrane protein